MPKHPLTRSLEITPLESRLLFSATAVAQMALMSEAPAADVETPMHHTGEAAPQAALTDNGQGAESVKEQILAEARQTITGRPQTGPSTGDFNHDGVVDVTDVNMMGKMLQETKHNSEYDLNRDGEITQLDLDVMIHDVLRTEYGDTDLDGDVDAFDAKVILGNLFQRLWGWQHGDMNFDSVVDGGDFIIWNAHKFETPEATDEALDHRARQPDDLTLIGQAAVLASEYSALEQSATPAPSGNRQLPEIPTTIRPSVDDADIRPSVTVAASNAETSRTQDDRLATPIPLVGPLARFRRDKQAHWPRSLIGTSPHPKIVTACSAIRTTSQWTK